MVFNLKTKEQKRAGRERWTRFFAIVPRPIGDGRYVWLQFALRRAVYLDNFDFEILHWRYRLLGGEE